MTPEGRVKKRVNAALNKLGSACWRFMPVQTGYGSPALDYLLVYKGRFIAIETKAPGKKLTPLQESTKAAIEAAGGIVLVVWDETTLSIALQIILAMEFVPHAFPDPNGCLKAAGVSEKARSIGVFGPANEATKEQQKAYRRLNETEQPAEAFDEAVGRDHGSPRRQSKRRTQPSPRFENPRITAAVTSWPSPVRGFCAPRRRGARSR